MKNYVPIIMISSGVFLLLWVLRCLIIVAPVDTTRTTRELVYTFWPVLDPILIFVWALVTMGIQFDYED